ncbi:GNAT family N-acetyltransferase [Bosea sp. 117]|uniref:GNAT family N-acetyltransferase n=1 Tax=Bosea sp. 117 TaxID=1125973 RepID=UPI000494AB60|nr:GNAT family N-acetyltransferase [Bosea sp. 117]
MITLRSATEADLPAILAIYNHEVLHSTSIWNETPADLKGRAQWLADRQAKSYPVLVADEDGAVLGYASFGDFRPFEGYRISVEHSVYVAREGRGRGLGRMLLEALFEPARGLGKKVMIGGITAGNEASIALHGRLGFVRSGYMPGIGIKFGQRLDLVLMQKEL